MVTDTQGTNKMSTKNQKKHSKANPKQTRVTAEKVKGKEIGFIKNLIYSFKLIYNSLTRQLELLSIRAAINRKREDKIRLIKTYLASR